MLVYWLTGLVCIGSIITGFYSLKWAWIILCIPFLWLAQALWGMKLRKYKAIPELSEGANELFLKYGYYYQFPIFCQECSSSFGGIAITAIALSVIGLFHGLWWFIPVIVIAHVAGIILSKAFSPKNFLIGSDQKESHNEIVNYVRDEALAGLKASTATHPNVVDLNSESIPADEYITTFFKDPSEYMHFLMDCKDMAIATDKDPSCMALLTKQDSHYVYLVQKNGKDICENIKPFRANEANIQKFNEGCKQCAQLLSRYIRTSDPKQMPNNKPFGDLTWDENCHVEESEDIVENDGPDEHQYFPEVKTARIVKRIDFGSHHEMTLMTDVDAAGAIKYYHLLTVVSQPDNEIWIVVSAEKGFSHAKQKAVCFLCAFTGGKHKNYGIDDACMDVDIFEQRAKDIVRDEYGLTEIGEEL
jgi:hypothetical protein